MFSRAFRQKGVINLSTYLKSVKVGDLVDIVANAAVHKGMPHKFYHGRTGTVFNVTPRAVGVEVNKQVGGFLFSLVFVTWRGCALSHACLPACPPARPSPRHYVLPVVEAVWLCTVGTRASCLVAAQAARSSRCHIVCACRPLWSPPRSDLVSHYSC
jgi:ribosomal protein L21E